MGRERARPPDAHDTRLVLFSSCSFKHCNPSTLKWNILFSDSNLSNEGVELVAQRKNRPPEMLTLRPRVPSGGRGWREAGVRSPLGLVLSGQPAGQQPPRAWSAGPRGAQEQREGWRSPGGQGNAWARSWRDNCLSWLCSYALAATSRMSFNDRGNSSCDPVIAGDRAEPGLPQGPFPSGSSPVLTSSGLPVTPTRK